MNDDWRLQIDLRDEDHARLLTERIDAQQLQHDLTEAFHDRVIVTRDGTRVFFYSGTRAQADKACEAIKTDAKQHHWLVDIKLSRWHPIAEVWEEPGKALPANDAARQAERKALMTREREETARRGHPEFEVRVDLPSRHDAVRLSEQLQSEGLPTVRRWKYLLLGASDEDSAKSLATRIRAEAPVDSRVKVEGTWAAVYAECSSGPFAVLGGLSS